MERWHSRDKPTRTVATFFLRRGRLLYSALEVEQGRGAGSDVAQFSFPSHLPTVEATPQALAKLRYRFILVPRVSDRIPR